MEYSIKSFDKKYQKEAKQLILSGLEEHWGTLDFRLNLDLQDIANHYKNDIFLIGLFENEIIATGAAIIKNGYTAEIVRMSIHKNFRRKGIGKRMLNVLIKELKKRAITKVILETTKT